MKRRICESVLSLLVAISLVVAPVAPVYAAFVATQDWMTQQQQQLDRQQLAELLSSEQARNTLLSMGVAPDQALERVQRLTTEELAQLNSQLNELPAGGDILGLLVLLFIVFIITDMLGATDLFPFVHPINKDKGSKD